MIGVKEILSVEEIEDLIDLWHEGAGADLPLHEFLGMTWVEYARFAETNQVPAVDDA